MTTPQADGAHDSPVSSGNAVEKVIRLVEATTEPGGPHRLGDIASAAGVGKPSAHRILATLVSERFLVNDGTGRYGAGPRLRALSARLGEGNAPGIDDVLAELQRQVGQTVHMALRSGDRVVYTHKVNADQPYRMASRVGMSLPLHCTAIGKCVLAHMTSGEVDNLVSTVGLPRRTPATITEPDHLTAELDQVRANGFAVDDEENESTVRCLAAPILDDEGRPLGGISVSTLTLATSRDELEGYGDHVREATMTMSRLLMAS